MQRKFKKSTKGITLIALVITIIILIILAGIAIASLGGENGLFARAREAKEVTKESSAKEKVTIAVLGSHDDDGRLSVERLKKEIERQGGSVEGDTFPLTVIMDGYEYIVESTGEITEKGTTGGGDEPEGPTGETITGVDTKITNPVGAMPSNATVIEGDATEGIVIQDESENEWVWVEVPKTAEVYPNVGINLDVNNITDEQCTAIYNDLAKYVNAYRDSDFSDTFDNGNGFNSEAEYNTAKNNMIRSIYKYGGFWIGRYEVGIENSYRNYGDDYFTEYPITETPVIKVNTYPYNYVTCNQAQELSNRLSTGGKTGSLMLGIQWDLTCKFLETRGGLSQEQIKEDSKDWGNHYDSTIMLTRGRYNKTGKWLDITPGAKNGGMLLTTGASEDTNKMNIYDLAGNANEWTLEQYIYSSVSCAYRGGVYNHTGSSYPASSRSCISALNDDDIALRSILY